MRANPMLPGGYGAEEILRSSAIGAMRNCCRRVAATLHLWRTRRRNRRELAGLDERTLRDIGLTRSAAEFLVNKPFWRE
jgi:uncharacterized protein YjiS (DUF1127 family)